MRRIGTLNHKPIVEGDSNIVDRNSILYKASSGNLYKRNSKGELESISQAEETDGNPFAKLSNSYRNREIITESAKFVFISVVSGQYYICVGGPKGGSMEWECLIPSSTSVLAVVALDTAAYTIDELKKFNSKNPQEVSEEEYQSIEPVLVAHYIGGGNFSGAEIPNKLVTDNAMASDIIKSLLVNENTGKMVFPLKTIYITPS